MSRRRFFAGVAAGAGATAIPHWLAHEFGLAAGHLDGDGHTISAPTVAPSDLDQDDDGCEIADLRRRGLLVLIIPEEGRSRWDRGYGWGALLNHGTDHQLAALAAVDVRCAFASELEELGGTAVAGEPWAVLVDRVEHRSHPIEIDFGDTQERLDGEQTDAETTESLEQIELLASAIDDAIVERLSTLLTTEAERMQPDDRARLDRKIAERRPIPHQLLERGAARVLSETRIAQSQIPTAYLEAILAEAVRQRLVTQTVSGSRWAYGGGCGVQLEGEPPRMVACGMGHVPGLSRRFLYFFADAE